SSRQRAQRAAARTKNTRPCRLARSRPSLLPSGRTVYVGGGVRSRLRVYMRTPKTAVVPKMPSLLTGAVVVASAVAGYAASLAWPLPAAYVAVLSPSTVAASPDVRALDRASPAQDVAAKPPVADTSPQHERTAAA